MMGAGGVFFFIKNHHGRNRRCTILCVVNVCLLLIEGPCPDLIRLEAHNSLRWIRNERIFDIITSAPVGRRFMTHRQADQASAEIRGTRAQSNLFGKEASTIGTEYTYFWSS